MRNPNPSTHAMTQQRLAGMRARSVATKNRRIMRRLRCEAVLSELLPPLPAPGMSIHTISHGDIDSLSYLSHAIKAAPFDAVLISTWCMAMPDIDWILAQIANGRIGKADFYCGEIFPGTYCDECDKLDRAQADGQPVTLTIARNHSKVMLASNAADDIYLVMESSANVNTNPRIEQTVMTRDKELYEFYAEFYAGITSVHKNPYLEKRPQ